MRTVGVFCFGEELSEGPSCDPEEILPSERSEDVEPPLHVVQAYGWE